MLSEFKLAFVLMIWGLSFNPDVMAGNPVPDTANFVLVKEDDGIAIYERWYSVRPNQSAREIKATFLARAHPGAAAALIKDESRARLWNKNTRAYRIVHQTEHMWFGYIQYDLPWPVSNQDCVLEYRLSDLGTSLEVKFKETKHPSFPQQKRVQRIPEINGKWLFTEHENGISVEYYITTTPSATLPTWLTDPIIRNNLIETLQVFRHILEHEKISKRN